MKNPGATTLSVMTFGRMTFIITPFMIMASERLSKTVKKHFAKGCDRGHSANCRSAECLGTQKTFCLNFNEL
jgi:hypothetical protein